MNNVRALRVGVERILEEGLEARWRRHREVAEYLREGLRDLGLELFVPDEISSHGVTSVIAPNGKADELLAYLREQHGLLLAGSLGELKGKIFRIGHIGLGATKEVINSLFGALGSALGQLKEAP